GMLGIQRGCGVGAGTRRRRGQIFTSWYQRVVESSGGRGGAGGRNNPRLRKQITKCGRNVEPISGRVSQRTIRQHLNRPEIESISHLAESEAMRCYSPCDED